VQRYYPAYSLEFVNHWDIELHHVKFVQIQHYSHLKKASQI
jgi:hypothetical protein